MKLAQATVNAGCKAAQARYAKMPEQKAKEQFAYELQGFAADMVNRGVPLPTVLIMITELMGMVARANDLEASDL